MKSDILYDTEDLPNPKGWMYDLFYDEEEDYDDDDDDDDDDD